MQEKELFIFDYDGVLVNSVGLTFKTIILSAEELKIKAPSFSSLIKNWGVSFEDHLFPDLAKELAWSKQQKDQVLGLFLEKNRELIYPLPSSINYFLNEMKRMGKDLAILSNRDLNSLVSHSFKSSLNLKVFTEIVCPNNGLFKPDARIFDYFWRLGYSPKKTIFVGDSIRFDLTTANNHLPVIDFIAITSGLHTKKEFIQKGVRQDWILENPKEILNFLTLSS
jgi:phosphoglycolate phosphatase-like HAD superfamily hydrolase